MVSERRGQVRHSLGAEQTELVSDWDEERGEEREDGWFGGPGPGGENISEAVMRGGAHRRTGGRRGRSAERGCPTSICMQFSSRTLGACKVSQDIVSWAEKLRFS